MRKWTHLHSVGGGGIIALLLATHLIWVLTAVLLLGILIGRSWIGIKLGARKAGGVVDAQTRLQAERWKEVRSRRQAHVDKRRASREALERAYKLGVIEGMDGK